MSRRSSAVEKDSSKALQTKASEAMMIAQKPRAIISSQQRENRRAGVVEEHVYGSVERQNFVVLSMTLATICGCFNVLTLICSLPAILASIRVRSKLAKIVDVKSALCVLR